MKKTISVFMVVCIAITCMATIPCSAGFSDDPFLQYFENLSIEDTTNETDLKMFKEEFPDVFLVIEEELDTVDAIDELLMTKLKEKAAQEQTSQWNPYVSLIDKINSLHFERAIDLFNNRQSKSLLRGRPDALEVRNESRITVVNYGIREAEFIISAANGETHSHSYTITVGTDVSFTAQIPGEYINIGGTFNLSTSASMTKAYSLSGPADGAYIGGHTATSRIAFMLYKGSIQEYSYDLYYKSSGEKYMTNVMYLMQDSYAQSMTMLAHDGTPYYVQNPLTSEIVSFINDSACRTYICQNPDEFFS